MDEISNNVLLFLAIIAIGISVFGIYTTLTNVGPTLIGGAATTGTANVSVSEATTITINPANLSFVATAEGATRNSSINGDVIDCSADYLCGLNITNDGNVNVDIQLTVTDDMFTINLNGSTMMCKVQNHPDAVGAVNNKFTDDGIYTNTTFVTCNSSVGNIGGHAQFIDALNFTDGSDYAYVDVFICVPTNEPTGNKQSTLSFTASADS